MTVDLTDEEVRRERLAHIDQMLAEHDRKRQEIKLAPWQLVLGGATTSAAILAAWTAFLAFLIK
jgi:hypothetical protein